MKKPLPLLMGLVAIVTMVVIIILLSSTPTPREQSQDTMISEDPKNPEFLINLSRDQITQIQILQRDSELTISRNQDGRFQPFHSSDARWDDLAINQIISAGAVVPIQRTLGEQSNLQEFGFLEPVGRITINQTNGTVVSFLIGGMTPARDGYYVKLTDSQVVNIVSNARIQPLLLTIEQLRDFSLPRISLDRIVRFHIQTLGGRQLQMSYEQNRTERSEMQFSSYLVNSPFRRTFELNTHWFRELTDQIQKIEIAGVIDENPSDLSVFGLDPPQAQFHFVDRDGRQLHMLLGHEFDQETDQESDLGRYAVLANTSGVFLVKHVNPIITVNPYNAINPFVLIVNIDRIDSFQIETANEIFVGSISRGILLQDGQRLKTFFLNDREIEEQAFRRLYQWLIGLQFDAEIPQNSQFRVGLADPILTITYRLIDGNDLTVTFEPYDGQNFTVVRDNEAEFLITRATVQRMLNEFRQLP